MLARARDRRSCAGNGTRGGNSGGDQRSVDRLFTSPILRDATTALHRAQAETATSCELFDPAMRDRAVALLQLETDLRNGTEQNAFVVHYQPIVSLEIDEGGSEMVRAIVALAHSLSMDVVAEGVETEAQFIHLRALGCEYTQGFHFSKPVEAQAADTLIASQPWRDVLEATRSYSAYSANLSGERLSLG